MGWTRQEKPLLQIHQKESFCILFWYKRRYRIEKYVLNAKGTRKLQKNELILLLFKMKNMIAALFCICLMTSINAQYTTKERSVYGTTVDYPVRYVYIDRFNSWWPPSSIAQGLAVPGYASTNLPYNYVCLSFWTYSGGAVDAALVWSNPLYFIGAGVFGDTKQLIQETLKANYTKAGVKLVVSAFGATENPTSSNFDPVDAATKLADFVNNNQLDGVDVDWQDSPAFQSGDGKGENWLITFTKTLRSYLKDGLIITHAPQAPYFTTDSSIYLAGGYLAVHKAVGSMIDYYNIQFYNQGVGMYDTAETLFNVSGGWAPGTSINEMIASGVNAQKIVIGNPATIGDANNGWMSGDDIDAAIAADFPNSGWSSGIMFWQYSSDLDGSIGSTASKFLRNTYNQKKEEKKKLETE